MATPGYSHIGQHVSTLYQSGAPNGTWIAALFAVYNLLVLAFGVGVFRLVSNRGDVRRRIGRAGGVALVLTAIAGFMDDVFRQDPIGSPATTAGTLHVAFAGVASLLTILAIALVAAWALGPACAAGLRLVLGRDAGRDRGVRPGRRRRNGGPVADDGPARADPHLRLRPVGRRHVDHPRPVATCLTPGGRGGLGAEVVDHPASLSRAGSAMSVLGG